MQPLSKPDRIQNIAKSLSVTALRINYLQGGLELWMPEREHERSKKTLAQLIEAFAEEWDLELNGYGSTTFRNQATERGLEPIRATCLGNLREVPDIAIEVVVTSGIDWTSSGVWTFEKSGFGIRASYFSRNP